ncbi:MAG: hypothetical protein ACI4AH_04930 [Muribaculaceae bacterium]
MMEFFRSTEFYCLAIVVAIALLGLLLQQSPPKPAETYIVRLQLMPIGAVCDESVNMSVMPDGSTLLEHIGINAPQDVAINLVAERRGDRVTIVEKYAERISASDVGDVAWRGIASLQFLGNGRTAVRFESEVTGAWCTLSFLNVEGYSTSSRMSL